MINSGSFLVVADRLGLNTTGPRSVGDVFRFIEKKVICSRAVGSLLGTLA